MVDPNTRFQPHNQLIHEGAMANSNRTNGKYHLHIDLDHVYSPLQKRRGGDHIPETTKISLREEGAQHVDLWCDGSLYPQDPYTNSTPPFSNPTTLLRFAGDGNKGLLGYCNAISTIPTIERVCIEREMLAKLTAECNFKDEKIMAQEEKIEWLNKQLRVLRQKQTLLGPRQRRRKLRNIEDLGVGSGGIKKRIRSIRSDPTHPTYLRIIINMIMI